MQSIPDTTHQHKGNDGQNDIREGGHRFMDGESADLNGRKFQHYLKDLKNQGEQRCVIFKK